MTDTDTAELVAAFRAYIAACSGPGTTLYDGHPAVLMSKGIECLTALERERDEARALNNKYAWERDKAREERDAAERRSEAFWKPQLTASQAEVERLKDALKPFAQFAENNTDEEGWAGSTCQRERICDWFGPSDFRSARTALQPQVGK